MDRDIIVKAQGGPCRSNREAGVRRRGLVAGVLVGLVGRSAWAQAGRAAPAAAGIDLNSASEDELMTLDGIGERVAGAIVRARPFKAKTELVERRIIPEALYDKINGRVIVRPAAVPAPAAAPQRR